MILNEPYAQDKFLDFLENFLPDFQKDIRAIDSKKDGFGSIQKLGESKKLRTSVIVVRGKFNLESRISLARKSFKILRQLAIYRCLVVYLNEDTSLWRFSLLTATPKLTQEKVEFSFSNPKRHSYVLGPGIGTATARKYLIHLGRVQDYDELVLRFSVEAVNQDFYTEINNAFYQLIGTADENGNQLIPPMLVLPRDSSLVELQNYAVRLIGRILFIWFLKQKHSQNGVSLIPSTLTERFIGVDVLKSQLEPLFFEVLNKPLTDRESAYQTEAYKPVPYLNGGLFQPMSGPSGDFYLARSKDAGVQIADKWFHSLFEILGRYNFTIDENLENDVDLSIDPEMLGRVFENLLAEINPVTGMVARKSSGSYYTPRGIVNYMVDESLLQFFTSKTSLTHDKIKSILSFDNLDEVRPTLTESERIEAVARLSELRFFDPACGSGAFPIGMLQKLLWLIEQLDPTGQTYLSDSRQKHNVSSHQKSSTGYRIKKQIIRNSIFGSDIQPIALEISRLRCFLSLIVDQEVLDNEANRGIDPLPNLEFQFVCANSLIFLSDKEDQLIFGDDPDLDERLIELRDQYFDTSNYVKKDGLQKKYLQLIGGEENLFGDSHRTAQLKTYNPFQAETAAAFFDPRQMFGFDYFDIVLANPPYIDSHGMINSGQGDTRDFVSKHYSYAKGAWDIYIAFFERGLSLLTESGTLVFITPDKWLAKGFGEALRSGKLQHIKSILIAGREVFDSAKVDSVITVFTAQEQPNLETLTLNNGSVETVRWVDKSIFKPPFALDIALSKNFDFVLSCEARYGQLGEFCTFESACATSDAYKLKPLVTNLSGEFVADKYLKVINTGTILPYSDKWGRSEMVYLGDKYLHPVVRREIFLQDFPNSYSYKSQQRKIIIKGLNLLHATMDEEGIFIPGIPTLIGLSENHDNLYFALGVINSRFAMFYIKNRYPGSSYNQGTTFTRDMLMSLPVPINIPESKMSRYILKVKELLLISGSNVHDLGSQQTELDSLLEDMYGFTDGEKSLFQ